MTALIERHALIVRRGRILLEQSQNRWRGMWILPPLQPEPPNQRHVRPEPVYEAVFPFTHHRVTLSVHRAAIPKRMARRLQWFKSTDKIAIPSPHRRAIEALLNANLSVQQQQHKSSRNGS